MYGVNFLPLDYIIILLPKEWKRLPYMYSYSPKL